MVDLPEQYHTESVYPHLVWEMDMERIVSKMVQGVEITPLLMGTTYLELLLQEVELTSMSRSLIE